VKITIEISIASVIPEERDRYDKVTRREEYTTEKFVIQETTMTRAITKAHNVLKLNEETV
jgi:hypothetical protein